MFKLVFMSTKKVFIATVHVLVFADSEGEACDALTESLTNNLMEAGAIVDWQYIDKNGVSVPPAFAGHFNNTDPEGEIFNQIFNR
jgi:hypothetical protein